MSWFPLRPPSLAADSHLLSPSSHCFPSLSVCFLSSHSYKDNSYKGKSYKDKSYWNWGGTIQLITTECRGLVLKLSIFFFFRILKALIHYFLVSSVAVLKITKSFWFQMIYVWHDPSGNFKIFSLSSVFWNFMMT